LVFIPKLQKSNNKIKGETNRNEKTEKREK
jgi:hypothetical protein